MARLNCEHGGKVEPTLTLHWSVNGKEASQEIRAGDTLSVFTDLSAMAQKSIAEGAKIRIDHQYCDCGRHLFIEGSADWPAVSR